MSLDTDKNIKDALSSFVVEAKDLQSLENPQKWTRWLTIDHIDGGTVTHIYPIDCPQKDRTLTEGLHNFFLDLKTTRDYSWYMLFLRDCGLSKDDVLLVANYLDCNKDSWKALDEELRALRQARIDAAEGIEPTAQNKKPTLKDDIKQARQAKAALDKTAHTHTTHHDTQRI